MIFFELLVVSFFEFLGPRKIREPFFDVETQFTRIYVRRVTNIFSTHRLELFLKGLFLVTIRKFVVNFVWRKCHFSHFLEMKLDWQPCRKPIFSFSRVLVRRTLNLH